MKADWSDPPPCGTACGLCRDHFCPAKGYVGEMPVCRECGEGKPCARAQAVKKAMETPPLAVDGLHESSRDERRCTDCRGALSDQTVGPECWPCKKRNRIAAKSQRDAERVERSQSR